MTERMIERDGVRLCTESFGDPADPPVLLVMGMSASMLWWDEGFCRMLAAGGRFVVRYDHRDTGRSQTDEPGRPGLHREDLVRDIAPRARRVRDRRGAPARACRWAARSPRSSRSTTRSASPRWSS